MDEDRLLHEVVDKIRGNYSVVEDKARVVINLCREHMQLLPAGEIAAAVIAGLPKPPDLVRLTKVVLTEVNRQIQAMEEEKPTVTPEELIDKIVKLLYFGRNKCELNSEMAKKIVAVCREHLHDYLCPAQKTEREKGGNHDA